MSVSSAYIEPSKYLERFVGDVARAKSGLSEAELREMDMRAFVEYSIMDFTLRMAVRWNSGDGDYRQLLAHVKDVDMKSALNATDEIRRTVEKQIEAADMRGELHMHRLSKKLPKKIQSIICSPAVWDAKEPPLEPGEMLVIFRSGAKLRCTELETQSDAFIAKCLMLCD